jgi:hypothetical protein
VLPCADLSALMINIQPWWRMQARRRLRYARMVTGWNYCYATAFNKKLG